jgi:hypothetical protein
MEIRCESARVAPSGNEEDVVGEAGVAAVERSSAHLATVTGGRCVYAARQPGETIVP